MALGLRVFMGQKKCLVAAAAEDGQQKLEHEDKIEIEFEGADDGAFADHGRRCAGRLAQGHLFDGLAVVCGQAGEYHHADIADDHLHAGAVDEEIDHRSDQDANQPHEVGLRQPYPGIITFFLLGVIISRLCSNSEGRGGGICASETKWALVFCDVVAYTAFIQTHAQCGWHPET
jgi:hypothetical protein